MPKEFVLYMDNSTLQYIMRQHKLNHKHPKWVEFLQSFTFVLKHISGKANKVFDALCRRCLIMHESQIQILGFDYLKDLYDIDVDFKEAFVACKNPTNRDNSPWKTLCRGMGYCSRTISYVFPIAQCGKTWSKKSMDTLVLRKHLGS